MNTIDKILTKLADIIINICTILGLLVFIIIICLFFVYIGIELINLLNIKA